MLLRQWPVKGDEEGGWLYLLSSHKLHRRAVSTTIDPITVKELGNVEHALRRGWPVEGTGVAVSAAQHSTSLFVSRSVDPVAVESWAG